MITDLQMQILIVDDQEANVRLLEGLLAQLGYTNLHSTTDPRKVLELFATLQPDIILLDLHMPDLDGFEVLEQLNAVRPEGAYLPILVLTADITPEAKHRALRLGAADFLTKPIDALEVLLRIRNLLATRRLHGQLQQHNQRLEEKVYERTRDLEVAQATILARNHDLEATQREILARLSYASEYRDDQTGQHIQRVQVITARVAQAFGLPAAEVDMLRQAGSLHDVGKIGIPDAILLKPGKLTPEERTIMQTHTTIGSQILAGSPHRLLQVAEEIAWSHHEHWNGGGYPTGRAGDAIPLSGRIVAVADVFDALTSERPYKVAWPVAEAVAEIARLSGSQFDPRVVAAFLQIMQEHNFVHDLEIADEERSHDQGST